MKMKMKSDERRTSVIQDRLRLFSCYCALCVSTTDTKIRYDYLKNKMRVLEYIGLDAPIRESQLNLLDKLGRMVSSRLLRQTFGAYCISTKKKTGHHTPRTGLTCKRSQWDSTNNETPRDHFVLRSSYSYSIAELTRYGPSVLQMVKISLFTMIHSSISVHQGAICLSRTAGRTSCSASVGGYCI
jgi:hypothetical protein